MILDMQNNIARYASLNENFRTAVDYILTTNLDALTPGRIPIDGNRVYAVITEKQLTAEPEAWEVHQQYADIHLLLGGAERIGFCPQKNRAGDFEFPADKDNLAVRNVRGMEITLETNEFVVFFPYEVHRPNAPPGTAGQTARKLMIKVLCCP